MTTWTNVEKKANLTAETYNSASLQYNEPTHSYNGKLQTVWTNLSKSI